MAHLRFVSVKTTLIMEGEPSCYKASSELVKLVGCVISPMSSCPVLRTVEANTIESINNFDDKTCVCLN